MRPYARHLLTVLGAAIVLSALVSTASANRLSISNRLIRVTWSSLSFQGEGLAEVKCPVTLEGSFHSATIRKVVGALIGAITRANVRRPCTGGTAWAHNGEANEVLGGTVRNALPWHLTYEGFGGTLPNITSLRVLLARALFLIRASFGFTILCSYITGPENGGNPTGIIAIGAGGVASTITESGSITSGDPFCPGGTFEGTGRVMLLGNTSSISVRLI